MAIDVQPDHGISSSGKKEMPLQSHCSSPSARARRVRRSSFFRDGLLVNNTSFFPSLQVAEGGGGTRHHQQRLSTFFMQQLCVGLLPRELFVGSQIRAVDHRARFLADVPRAIRAVDSPAEGRRLGSSATASQDVPALSPAPAAAPANLFTDCSTGLPSPQQQDLRGIKSASSEEFVIHSASDDGQDRSGLLRGGIENRFIESRFLRIVCPHQSRP